MTRQRMGRSRARILALILEGCSEGFPPTHRELATELGVCVHSVSGHIDALIRDGLIEKDATTARGFRARCRFLSMDELLESINGR